MQLTVLGCGAAYPRAGGACSGYLVSGGGVTVWVDAGNGTLSNLQRHRSYRDLDALVLSHRHADHIADVIPLMYARGFDPDRPPRLPLYAPPDVPQAILSAHGEYTHSVFFEVFEVRTLEGPFEVGGLRFECFRTAHPVETYGFRISDGLATLVYTADTADFPDLAEGCRGADLLLCEATYVRGMEGAPNMHLWATQAGALAAKAGAARLVVTHVWASADPELAAAEASEAYGAPVEAAVEGAVYEL